jgi:LuxR family transcriptional regulator
MTSPNGINELTLLMNRIAPDALKLTLRIEAGKPLRTITRIDEKIRRILMARNSALQDPAMAWGLNNDGFAPWSHGIIPDPYNNLDVLRRAGLPYGGTWAIGSRSNRSVMSALRRDREFTLDEVISATNALCAAHAKMSDLRGLTPSQIEALSLVGSGERHARAAVILEISESGFKARLKSARARLGARTTAEAIRAARDLNLI